MIYNSARFQYNYAIALFLNIENKRPRCTLHTFGRIVIVYGIYSNCIHWNLPKTMTLHSILGYILVRSVVDRRYAFNYYACVKTVADCNTELPKSRT